MPKVLLVDDEDQFRSSLAKRLTMRGYEVVEAANGDDAIKIIRNDRDVDVVLLDRKMPGKTGEQTLEELKVFRPEIQVIFLTAFGSLKSATEAGKLDAFHYLEKPVEDLDRLIEVIESARAEKVHAMARNEIPHVEGSSFWKKLLGTHNSRPLFILAGILLLLFLVLINAPDRLVELISTPKTAPAGQVNTDDINMGYSTYMGMREGETISHYYSNKYHLGVHEIAPDGTEHERPLNANETAHRAMVMLAVLLVAALFWASGAVPVGVTALIVAVLMYFFDVLRPDDIAQAFAKDSVIFIFGVLALSKAITKTGLDRRIGLLLLAPAKNITLYFFIFLPLMAVTCSFVSEHALIAFITPLFVMIYASSIRKTGIKKDKQLMVMFILSLCFVANLGGPGSPAAGGRNAVMIGILADYGIAPTFGEWVRYGLPFVPVAALAVATYFFFAFRKKIKIKKIEISNLVRQASESIGPMNREEYITAAVLIGVIILWITASNSLGMGGPVVLGLVVLNIFRVLRWRDIQSIHWEVVFLYAGASAIGKGLAVTGAALYLADSFVSVLPGFLQVGNGLAIATSLFTGLCTNFMSDGATVAAIGPITVPMARIAEIHPWMVGFATAFASSFAHMLIIGTPNNAIAYAMAKDPVTGEQLVSLGDFLKHGAAVLVISFGVLWIWTFYGYWSWIGFPALQ